MKEDFKKYKIIKDDSRDLLTDGRVYRIVALKDIFDCSGNKIVTAGSIGGYVSSYANLSQKGSCWIFDNASVAKKAVVTDNACVKNSVIVSGDSAIKDNAVVSGNAAINASKILGNALITGNTFVDSSWVKDNAVVRGKAHILCESSISGSSVVEENARIEKSLVTDNAVVSDFSVVKNNAIVCMNAKISGFAIIDSSTIEGKVTGRSIIDDSRIDSKSSICEGTVSNTSIKNMIMDADYTIGKNLFNDEKYTCEFYNKDILNILEDNNKNEYIVVPVSKTSCMTFMPRKYVNMCFPSDLKNLLQTNDEIHYSTKNDLWIYLTNKLQFKCSENKVKKVICNFLKRTTYHNLESIINSISTRSLAAIVSYCEKDSDKIIINSNYSVLLYYLENYLFAHFVGLLLYCCDSEQFFTCSKDKSNYIDSLTDRFVIDMTDFSVISIEKRNIFINKEIITMIRKVCKTGSSWLEKNWNPLPSILKDKYCLKIISLLD